jgi:hypothetical protein
MIGGKMAFMKRPSACNATAFIVALVCIARLASACAASVPAAIARPPPTEATPSAASANQGSIRLNGKSVQVTGKGVSVKAGETTIVAAGTYRISGSLDEGRIVIDSHDQQLIKLVLDNASIHSTSGAPIEVRNGAQVQIELAAGSNNLLTDSAGAVGARAGAALFSHDNLLISGAGALTVRAGYRDGIASNDTLTIASGKIEVTAANDALRGKDALLIQGGEITVSTGGGSRNASSKTARDFLGRLSAVASNGAEPSRKGLKSGGTITISAGKLNIDAADDAINAKGKVIVGGGEIRIASGDDAVHADQQIQLNGGKLVIAQSYEGLESAAIRINGGTLHLVAADDGINIVSGNSAGGAALVINDGSVYVDSGGDGIDANAAFEMNGGTVLVNGPVERGNGALDADGGIKVTGGLLIASGSAGMVEAPGNASSQNSVRVYFPAELAAGTPVTITSEDGKPVVQFVPNKRFQSLVLSTPRLEQGKTYIVYTGGQPGGAATSGFYPGAVAVPGTETLRFTVNSVATTAGSGARGGRRGMGRERR